MKVTLILSSADLRSPADGDFCLIDAPRKQSVIESSSASATIAFMSVHCFNARMPLLARCYDTELKLLCVQDYTGPRVNRKVHPRQSKVFAPLPARLATQVVLSPERLPEPRHHLGSPSLRLRAQECSEAHIEHLACSGRHWTYVLS